tara:strand:- start:1016 stop:2347 length:1332 start_codon:yes stop_codon:yes gene_type:complete
MSLQNFFSAKNLVNLIFLLIPISYIAGNLLLNLNIIILIIFVFSIYRFETFKISIGFLDKLIIIFFIYLIANGLYNNYFNFDYPDAPKQNIILSKSFLFLRYFFLYFVLRFLLQKNIVEFKLIFLIFGSCSLFVSIDLLIQFYFGSDLFGFEGGGRRLAGPFGDEYIAGSYVQRLFIFLVFFLLILEKIYEKKFIFYISFILIIFLNLFGILFSGNRIPLVLSLMMLGLLFLYQKSLRRVLVVLFISFFMGVSYFVNTNQNISNHFASFKTRSYETLEYVAKRVTQNQVLSSNTYIKEIESGILTWQENKYLGGGIKSFFWNCNNIDRDKMINFVTKKGKVNCNTHPHNYYLEIGAELGFVGITLILSIFILIIFKSLKVLNNPGKHLQRRELLIPFFIIFIVEIFPIKTTGSFFTTTNSTFLFIIIAFIVGLLESKSLRRIL